jgi:hypothetical protein
MAINCGPEIKSAKNGDPNMTTCEMQLLRLLSLSDGWLGEGSIGPSAHRIRDLIRMLRFETDNKILWSDDVRAYPTVEGNIEFEWESKNGRSYVMEFNLHSWLGEVDIFDISGTLEDHETWAFDIEYEDMPNGWDEWVSSYMNF